MTRSAHKYCHVFSTLYRRNLGFSIVNYTKIMLQVKKFMESLLLKLTE